MARIALVTGGTRGIGFAIASALLEAGDQVVVTGTSDDSVRQALDAFRDKARGSAAVTGVVCDVRQPAMVEAALRDLAARQGGLDVLVNSAGVGIGAPVAELSHDEWQRIIGINLSGVFHCCKAAIPYLRQRGGGWIINISSLSSTVPFIGGAAYCASKAGLNAFTEALMQEVRHDNIKVSVVLPGSVATGFSGRPATAGSDWKLQPEDVAQVVIDLLRHPNRSLPSRVEVRPSRPHKG
jgi:NAD(P)-dependent dehydrogenase (short-subunit alcohol dehydrogenase family)